jgi:hypothetical protein
MSQYLVLSPLVQPEYLLPELRNPKYDQPGCLVHIGELITDEPGGFLEHRTDPATKRLKASYYRDAVDSHLLVEIGDPRAPEILAGYPDELLRIYYAALEAQQPEPAPEPRKARKKTDIPEPAEEPAEEES